LRQNEEMKLWLCVWLIAICGATGVVAGEKPQTVGADLLDEAIWWPGNFGQVCRDDNTNGKFTAPPIPGDGARITQDYFLSEAMIERLKQKRPVVAEEIVKRLKVFDWRKFPRREPVRERVAAKAKSELGKAMAAAPGDAFPGPQKPENNRALGPQMLMIIEKIGAIEALPELLRLEEELYELNREAIREQWSSDLEFGEPAVPKVYVPPIETGDWTSYDERHSEWVKLGRPRKSAWLEWKGRVFANIHFQAQMLGVCLALLEQQKYGPLKESLVGRLLALGKKETADLPWADEVREEVRWLAQCYLAKDVPKPPMMGEALLEKLIRTPGDFSQMCDFDIMRSPKVPLPSFTHLTAKEHSFSESDRMRMQAYRDSLIPVLQKRLAKLDVTRVKPDGGEKQIEEIEGDSDGSERESGQRTDELGPLLLEMVEILQAIECLPDLVKLEQQLHALIVKAEKDPKAPVPEFRLHSALVLLTEALEDETEGDEKVRDRRPYALFTCTVYQRELLSLIKTLLVREEFPAMVKSETVRALRVAGERAMKPKLAEIRAEHEIPAYLRTLVRWNRETEKPELKKGAMLEGEIEYSEAVRDEIRRTAEAFLKEVPPKRWKGGDAMVVRWLERPYW
jgi:hypothetical protein